MSKRLNRFKVYKTYNEDMWGSFYFKRKKTKLVKFLYIMRMSYLNRINPRYLDISSRFFKKKRFFFRTLEAKAIHLNLKFRRYFTNINKKQLKRMVKKSELLESSYKKSIANIVETRVDAILLRSNLFWSIRTIRQWINHGFILANLKPVYSSNYNLVVGEVLSFKKKVKYFLYKFFKYRYFLELKSKKKKKQIFKKSNKKKKKNTNLIKYNDPSIYYKKKKNIYKNIINFQKNNYFKNKIKIYKFNALNNYLLQKKNLYNKRIPKRIPKKINKRIPKRIFKRIPKRIFKRMPKRVLKRTPKRILKRIPKKINKKIPKKINKKINIKRIFKRIPKKINKKIPKKINKRISKKIPKKINKRIPKKINKKINKRIPKKINKKINKKKYWSFLNYKKRKMQKKSYNFMENYKKNYPLSFFNKMKLRFYFYSLYSLQKFNYFASSMQNILYETDTTKGKGPTKYSIYANNKINFFINKKFINEEKIKKFNTKFNSKYNKGKKNNKFKKNYIYSAYDRNILPQELLNIYSFFFFYKKLLLKKKKNLIFYCIGQELNKNKGLKKKKNLKKLNHLSIAKYKKINKIYNTQFFKYKNILKKNKKLMYLPKYKKIKNLAVYKNRWLIWYNYLIKKLSNYKKDLFSLKDLHWNIKELFLFKYLNIITKIKIYRRKRNYFNALNILKYHKIKSIKRYRNRTLGQYLPFFFPPYMEMNYKLLFFFLWRQPRWREIPFLTKVNYNFIFGYGKNRF